MVPGRPTAAGRLKRTASRSPAGAAGAGLSSISGSAAVAISAKVTSSMRPETRAEASAPSSAPAAIAGPPVQARRWCTSAWRPWLHVPTIAATSTWVMLSPATSWIVSSPAPSRGGT